MKNMYDVIVIGAGASGMMAAISCARKGKRTILLEKMPKAGKKLLATGNGKCNFTNQKMEVDCYYGNQEFIRSVLERFSVEDCLDFFHSIGIYPREKNGYYYPNSEQASSVVNALLQELERLCVRICYDITVLELEPEENQVAVICKNQTFYGKKVFLATGLLASPKLGSDGSMFSVIKSLGHNFSPILPALCGFYCKGNFKPIAGVRARGMVSAYINGNCVANDCGEIQFTEYGISGIPVFQISHWLSKGLYEKSKVQVKINLLPDFDSNELKEELIFRKNHLHLNSVTDLLNGLIHQKLSEVIFQQETIETVNTDIINKQLQEWNLEVIKARDYEFAQVCTGGIPVSQVNWDNLESLYAPNVHIIGELLDIDGICGGYNLHFAWATGYIAAQDNRNG